jgi:hypothetical protein
MHRVAFGAQDFRESVYPRGEPLCVVEQQYLCRTFL